MRRQSALCWSAGTTCNGAGRTLFAIAAVGPDRMSPAILCLRFVAAPALVALLAGVASAQTVNNFEVAGTPYAEAHSNVAPVVLAGGPTGNFLRLASTPAVNIGTVAFARTDSVVNQVTADFDFRIIPPPAGRNQAADGMGFALLNTSVAGFETGPRWDGVPEWARFPGAIGVGFRIFNMNAVSIAFDGTERTLVSIPTATVDLASGQFIHAHIVFRPGGGHSDVTVTLTPSGGSPVTVIDRFVVSGVKPYPARVWFGARSGGLSADHDLVNVNV